MPRIRTIQPSFTRSRSMARVSRDARLLFILLWTVADDAGRLLADRAELVPMFFDDHDASMFMTAWLDELERERCIERYAVDGVDYLRVVKWADYQKIDHPTASILPPSPEEDPDDSRIREGSRKSMQRRLKMLEEQLLELDSRNALEKEIDESPPASSEEGVLNDLYRVQKQSEERGQLATALRSIDLRGRRLGLWAGKAAKKKKGPGGYDPDDIGPSPAEILMPELYR
jgi:hypothetical protein